MSVEEQVELAARRRKRNKIITLIILLIILIILLILLYLYLFRKKPITAVLPMPGPPRYLTSVYANFDFPVGVAVNPKGNRIYVVDSNKTKIYVFNERGKELFSFGKTLRLGETEGFISPFYIAVDPKGRVFISDRSAAAISIYSPKGKFISRFVPKVKPGFVWSPLALTFDRKGNLYLTDAKKGEHRVLVFDPRGRLKLKFGKEGTKRGQFSYPNGIAVDNKGKIYVADSNNNRVQVFNSRGKWLYTLKGRGRAALVRPTGIAINPKGEICIVDTFADRIMVYDSKGRFLYKFGRTGFGEGEFRFPGAIAISKDGRVFIVDQSNRRLQIWQY